LIYSVDSFRSFWLLCSILRFHILFNNSSKCDNFYINWYSHSLLSLPKYCKKTLWSFSFRKVDSTL